MNKQIAYIKLEHLDYIFWATSDAIADQSEPMPSYLDEPAGVEQVKGVLARITSGYYPNFLAKAAYLFLAIAKGHFFSNGNKRLAVASLKIFYTINGYNVTAFSTGDIDQLLMQKFQISNISQVVNMFKHSPELYFLYTIAKIMTDEPFSEVDFDLTKKTIEDILELILVKK